MQTSSVNTSNTQAVAMMTAAAAAPNPNAILSRYQPTGASAVTARQDGLSAGVGASQKMAQADLARLQKYKGAFEAAAAKHGLPPALLAAIASRESRAGAALDRNGRGDGGNGFGLMQIDFRYHSPRGGPYSAEHIDQAAGILKTMLNQVKAKHPSWPPEQQLRGAVAAYNSGVSNVQTIAGMDRGTTGNDYSNDVWARAQALAPKFGGTTGTTGPTPPSTPSTGSVLKKGASGPEVKQLQEQLNKLGYSVGTADGEFGPKTEAAVKKFQAAKGLEADGVVGPKTREALQQASSRSVAAPQDGFQTGAARASWTPAPSLEEVKKNGKLLKEGMQGPAVQHLQQLLGISADGKFGPATKKAVADYQKASGLNPGQGNEGVVGKTTLEHLEKSGGTAGVDGISAKGRQQMQALLDIAQRNSSGKRPDGKCLWHVNNWLDKTAYAQIGNGKSPRFPLARNYGDWLNKNHQELGLKKLNLDNPYKAPPGAIVVVRPGTPGTRHPTAGDIVVVGKNGHFYNGGEMGYGGSHNFPPGNKHVIGIFVPN
ncbi:MAG TPA: peptidoglycan-binding protein [Myxococcaceae bacterium]|jgi:peptidoglycan hydrolase-like protein with peptidoglycan-binding domain